MLNYLKRLLGAVFRPTPPAPPEVVRDIETRGCMATDYRVREGTVIHRFTQHIAGGGSKLYETYRIKLSDTGEIIERVREAAYRAPDGVLEWRW